jgi:hypothetical protein
MQVHDTNTASFEPWTKLEASCEGATVERISSGLRLAEVSDEDSVTDLSPNSSVLSE